MLRSRREPALLVAALTATALSLGTATAVADPSPPIESPPPGDSSIVPPKLLSPPEVGYPAGAAGEASVILVITVNADGSVRAARVETGDEPFASSAARAALGWRFEPASRNGAAIAAIVRAEVVFRPPPVPSESPAEPSD